MQRQHKTSKNLTMMKLCLKSQKKLKTKKTIEMILGRTMATKRSMAINSSSRMFVVSNFKAQKIMFWSFSTVVVQKSDTFI